MTSRATLQAVSLLWLGALATAACAFLTQVLLARKLGPTEFGLFAGALATVAIVTPLAGFGIQGFWLKVFGEEGWRATRWLSPSFRFVAVTAMTVSVALAMWAVYGPHGSEMQVLLFVLAPHVIAQLAVGLVAAKLQLEERYSALAAWQLAPHIFRLSSLIIAAHLAGSIFGLRVVACVYFAVALLFAISGGVQLMRMNRGRFALKGHEPERTEHPTDHLPNAWLVAIQAWPFGLAEIFYLVYFQSDIVLLKYLAGDRSAGFYNVAFVVMAAVYLLPSVIYQRFLLPKLHRWTHQDPKLFHQSYRVGVRSMLAIGVVAMLFIWLSVPLIVPKLFGAEYQQSVGLLRLLAVCAPIRFVSASIGAVLTTRTFIFSKVRIMGFAALANLLLNIMMIPELGAKGAAIATIVAETVIVVGFAYVAEKRLFATE